MIVVGTAVVNPSTQEVELRAPLGFGTARGVRVSNFTGDTITLTNISGVDQSQEFLAPQTQMVYRTTNVGAVPTAVGRAYPPAQIANNILIEWSTEPDSDFLGTYPAALPAAISNTVGTGQVFKSNSLAVIGALNTVGSIPTQYALVSVELTTAGGGAFQVLAAEIDLTSGAQGAAASMILAAPASGTFHFLVPVKLTHTHDLTVLIADIGTSPAVTSSLKVYATAQVFPDIPLVYCDIPEPLHYAFTGAVPAAPNDILLASDALAGNPTFSHPLGEVFTTLNMRTSGVGKLTPGFIQDGPASTVFATSDEALPVYTGTTHDTVIAQQRTVADPATVLGPNLVYSFGTTNEAAGNIQIDVTVRQAREPYGSGSTV